MHYYVSKNGCDTSVAGRDDSEAAKKHNDENYRGD